MPSQDGDGLQTFWDKESHDSVGAIITTEVKAGCKLFKYRVISGCVWAYNCHFTEILTVLPKSSNSRRNQQRGLIYLFEQRVVFVQIQAKRSLFKGLFF
jgi:hypothetical protein